jgi:hypothetical protein
VLSKQGRKLKALLTVSQKQQSDGDMWGMPIDYRSLSDEELDRRLEGHIAALPVDLSEYEGNTVSDLIQLYQSML